jgi:hypothetical protein
VRTIVNGSNLQTGRLIAATSRSFDVSENGEHHRQFCGIRSPLESGVVILSIFDFTLHRSAASRIRIVDGKGTQRKHQRTFEKDGG